MLARVARAAPRAVARVAPQTRPSKLAALCEAPAPPPRRAVCEARALAAAAAPRPPLRPPGREDQQRALAAPRDSWLARPSAAAAYGAGGAWRLGKLALAAVAGAGAATLLLDPQIADACGIVAFVGKEPAVGYLVEGLHILQNRGYDSAGVATVNSKGEIVVTKHASKGTTSDSIQLVTSEAPQRHAGDVVGIAHTRWATHGGKTDENAHPHTDQRNRIALAHNGTIENADALKSELQALGIKFRSETDTEVIAQLIGLYLDQKMPLVDAVKKTMSRLEGTWGVVLLSREQPDQLIAACNGSPLVVGIGKDQTFIASEVSAFNRHTSDFIALKDGEIAVVKNNGGGSLSLDRVEQAPRMEIEMSPKPFSHWTIKEIMEQPEAVARTLNFGGRLTSLGEVKLGGLDRNRDMLRGVDHLVLSACGTSLYASMYGAQIMRSLGAFHTVWATDASEFSREMLPKQRGGLCVVSQSGETKDVHRTVKLAEEDNVPSFSVVNAVGSLIARTTRCGVYLNAGRENAVASTKAFTTQVTALALIAGWFSQVRDGGAAAASAGTSSTGQQKRDELLDSIHRLPTYIGMTLRVRDQVRKLAETLKGAEHMFILGKGYAYPIALESALKIKEITYIHAEGYGGGALKHGPFALLDKGVPVVLFILDDQHAELMKITASQVKGRGAYSIVVTDNPRLVSKNLADEVITIPSNGPLTALLGVIPMQLLAYEIAQLKGIDPDKPRNLAKAVTVD